MSDTKPCAYCGALIIREDHITKWSWQKRRFCRAFCAAQETSGDRMVTKDEAERFLVLVNKGASQTAAAKEIGRKQSSLLNAAIKHGLLNARIPAANDPCSTSPEEMLALFQDGLSYSEIAARCGISVKAVSAKVNQAKKREVPAPGQPRLPVEVPASTLNTRGPEPAGSDVSWGALGLGIPYFEALKLTQNMRAL